MKLQLPVQQAEPPVSQPLSEARITGGMNSRIDPADLPNNVAVLSKNSRTSADFTMRAPGVEMITETPPDAKPVLLYTQFQRFSGADVYLRFSEDRVDKFSGVWGAVTGTLTGGSTDRIRFTQTADASADYFIFTNNGADEIQVFNAAVSSFANLGNAGRFRYVTAFFNRIVAANKVDSTTPNPVLLAWSGDFNYAEWNPLTDVSAGSTPLQEAQSDYADPITGLFGFASVMLILRERSLWIATKRPVASNPFQFQAAFPSVGCDTPNSATQIPNGVIWYDSRKNQVYLFQVGQAPQEVGEPVRNDIKNAMSNRDLVWGSYDVVRNTYFLTVPSSSSTNTRIFAFNLDSGSWSYDDRESVYGVYHVDSGSSRLTYGQILGTYAQVTSANATYGDIGATAEAPAKNFYGYTDGEIGHEEDIDTDSEEFCWESKIYRSPVGDLMISRIMLLYEPTRPGTLTIEYRKNSGAWVNYKTQSFSAAQGRTRLYITKLIRANDFQWRLRSSTGNFKLYEYRLEVSASPEDK